LSKIYEVRQYQESIKNTPLGVQKNSRGAETLSRGKSTGELKEMGRYNTTLAGG